MTRDDARKAFEELAGHLDYPMYVVTAASSEARAGCLVGFASQCSIDPARFVVFLSVANFTYRVAVESPVLGVHVVPAGAEELARLFGEETGDETDKFEDCAWTPGPHGVPILEGCPDRFVGKILGRHSFGDHTGFVLEPVEVAAGGDSFFPFSEAAGFEPGHEA
ncbi:MAG: flavin reductase family protein [Actinomycetota bacterium]|nr:flavin reductase family protein [Actinomycetota bacterium]